MTAILRGYSRKWRNSAKKEGHEGLNAPCSKMTRPESILAEGHTSDGDDEGLSPMSSSIGTACLGVVVPTFNEETTVAALLKKVLERPEVAEVIAVDDGSSDATWCELEKVASLDPRIRLHRHPRNRGKGAAVKTALSLVTAPYAIVQDADLEYDPADYARVIRPLVRGEADVVYGSRFLDADLAHTTRWHRAGNGWLTAAARFITGLRLTDEATCYKAFRRELIPQLNLQEEGFGFCPEFTAKVARLKLRVVEVPVRYKARSIAEGKKIRIRHGVEALWCLVRYSWGPRG